MFKHYKTLAIVLTKKAWRESDLLFSFFTREYGKITAVAAGSRKIKSKLAGHLAGLGIIEMIFIKGKAFNKITHAHMMKNWKLADEKDFFFVSAIVDVINCALPEELKNADVWNLLMWAVEKTLFVKNSEEKKFILNIFILKLLPLIGFGINFKKIKFNLEFLNRLNKNNQGSYRITKGDNQKLFLFLKKYLEYHLEKEIRSFNVITSL